MKWKDTNCPYCGADIEINHDDGYGYEQNELHQQECWGCGRVFTYTTGITYFYETFKANCLNGGEHEWLPTITFPKEYTRMHCAACDKKRKPTEEEMKLIMQGSDNT